MAEKDIEPKLKLISNYLRISKEQQFVIPEYQRAYSWTISQCDKLWQDVENFIRSSEDSTDQDPYFFGTIILDVQDNQFNLIDGQQRTTTFILLLKALHLQIKKTLKLELDKQNIPHDLLTICWKLFILLDYIMSETKAQTIDYELFVMFVKHLLCCKSQNEQLLEEGFHQLKCYRNYINKNIDKTNQLQPLIRYFFFAENMV